MQPPKRHQSKFYFFRKQPPKAKTPHKHPAAKAGISVIKFGRKKGTGTPLKITSGYWYRACETFENQKYKEKIQAEFIRSALSGGEADGYQE